MVRNGENTRDIRPQEVVKVEAHEAGCKFTLNDKSEWFSEMPLNEAKAWREIKVKDHLTQVAKQMTKKR